MGVEGCTKCIKYMLFVFNFIFWLAGCVILGVALWLRHDPQTSSLMMQQIGEKQPPNTYYIGIYILLAVGAVMMFVGFVGCYGAIQESQCLLGTFFACLVILFACLVAAGIWGFIHRDQIANDMNNFYNEAWKQYTSIIASEADKNKAKSVLKVFHEMLDCCGTNVLTNVYSKLTTDDVCPSSTNMIASLGKDCHTEINELFSGKLYLIGIAAIVIAIIMIFEMILSMVLCCGIRNSSVY